MAYVGRLASAVLLLALVIRGLGLPGCDHADAVVRASTTLSLWLLLVALALWLLLKALLERTNAATSLRLELRREIDGVKRRFDGIQVRLRAARHCAVTSRLSRA